MDKDRVAEWQQLMLDWESALESYTEARHRKLGTRETESNASDEAFRRLLDIKRKIDDFVSRTRALRNRERDHIVLGTLGSIQRRMDSIMSSPDIGDTPPADSEKP